jgi:hypothetical protein
MNKHPRKGPDWEGGSRVDAPLRTVLISRKNQRFGPWQQFKYWARPF